jgi:hypothetical protein
MPGPDETPARKRKPAFTAAPVFSEKAGGTGLAAADALEVAYSHLRSALDAYAHDLYPASLARTFEQKGKTEALAGKLVENEEKWMGLLKTVDEHIALFKTHKLEHKELLEKANLAGEQIPHYEPPSEEELFQILPQEYVDFIKQPVPPPKGDAQPAVAEPLELSAVPDETIPANGSVAGEAAADAPLRFDNIKFDTAAPAVPAAVPAPPPPSRKPSALVLAAACGACFFAGAGIGYLAGGPLSPAKPAPLPPPVPAMTSVELFVDGSGFFGEKFESAGKVTIFYVKDRRSVTIYINSVAEVKPKPEARPKSKPKPEAEDKPKPKPKPKGKDYFPPGWELQ